MSVAAMTAGTSAVNLSGLWQTQSTQRVDRDGDGDGSSGRAGSATGRDRAEFSKFGQLMGKLSSLANSDPTKFKSVVSEMPSKLKDAAAKTTDANEQKLLTEMAERFGKAASSGQASDLLPPQGEQHGRPQGPPPGPPPNGHGPSDDVKSVFDQLEQEVASAVSN